LSEEVLKWEDIQWEKNRIYVRNEVGKKTKRENGNSRLVPISPVLREYLDWYNPKHDKCHYLAYHTDSGIGQLARWAGNSEATIKRHVSVLLPEAARPMIIKAIGSDPQTTYCKASRK
jgi:integrase